MRVNSPSIQTPQRDWTVLFYGGGVNNLDSAIQKTWNSLKDVELPGNVDTYIRHVDREGASHDYHLDRKGQALAVSSNPEKVNSADPKVLSNFLAEGMKKYPAAHYLVVISSHGQGAQGVIEDDNSSELMSPKELESALRTGKAVNGGNPIDAVLFDACQMASLEMASQLVGVVGVAIGSMDNIGSAGYELEEILDSASRCKNGKALGRSLVENQGTQQTESCNSLSATDLGQLGSLQSSVKELAKELKGLGPDGVVAVRNIVRRCRRNVASPQSQLGNGYTADAILSDPIVDQEFLELWLENEKPGLAVSLLALADSLLAETSLCGSNAGLKRAAENVKKTHDLAVYSHRASDFEEQVGGLTVRFPLQNAPGPLYSNSETKLRFEEMTNWEAAYDTIVPVDQAIPRPKTWLETELGL